MSRRLTLGRALDWQSATEEYKCMWQLNSNASTHSAFCSQSELPIISIFYSPDLVAQKQEQKRKKLQHRQKCSTVTNTAQIKNITLSRFAYYTLCCCFSIIKSDATSSSNLQIYKLVKDGEHRPSIPVSLKEKVRQTS